MRSAFFFFGLLLVGLGLGGQSAVPSVGSSAKSALPGVALGLLTWLFGPEVRVALIALGIAFMASAVVLHLRQQSVAKRGTSAKAKRVA